MGDFCGDLTGDLGGDAFGGDFGGDFSGDFGGNFSGEPCLDPGFGLPQPGSSLKEVPQSVVVSARAAFGLESDFGLPQP